jgi:hypothetical protein
VVSPAYHARPGNIWKEQVVRAVQGMVEETNGSSGTSGPEGGGQGGLEWNVMLHNVIRRFV